MQYFLGADIGSSKSHACVADETGTILGFGAAGAGNHESVGYEGMMRALAECANSALANAKLARQQIVGAGFGVSGFDWNTERPAMLETIATLGLDAPVDVVNDATLGLIAGSEEGWGIAVVSGTGCNCRGRTQDRTREGKVTGAGAMMGEGGGAGDLVQSALQALSHMWSRRGPYTKLADAMIERVGATSLEDFLEGIINFRYELNASAAPLVFQIAAEGDTIANALIQRAGRELGELANAVIRQLDFQSCEFEVVLVGSMFNSGEVLIRPLRETVLPLAPGARFVKLSTPPVIGGILLGMEQANVPATPLIRENLRSSVHHAPRARVLV